MAAEIFFAEEGKVWTGRYQEENQTGLTGTAITVSFAPEPISDPTGTVGVNDVSVWINGTEDVVTSVTGTTVNITTTLVAPDKVVIKYADWVISRECEVTNIDVSGGTRDIELIRAFNNCAIKKENPMDLIETTITAIKTNVDWAHMWMGAATQGSTITPTYPITITGDQTKSKWIVVYDYTKLVGALTEELRIVFKDAVCTDSPFTNASDGFIEETATFKTLPVDFLQQYTNDTSGSPLTKVLSGAGV